MKTIKKIINMFLIYSCIVIVCVTIASKFIVTGHSWLGVIVMAVGGCLSYKYTW